jgi:hypothetical protein
MLTWLKLSPQEAEKLISELDPQTQQLLIRPLWSFLPDGVVTRLRTLQHESTFYRTEQHVPLLLMKQEYEAAQRVQHLLRRLERTMELIPASAADDDDEEEEEETKLLPRTNMLVAVMSFWQARAMKVTQALVAPDAPRAWRALRSIDPVVWKLVGSVSTAAVIAMLSSSPSTRTWLIHVAKRASLLSAALTAGASVACLYAIPDQSSNYDEEMQWANE